MIASELSDITFEESSLQCLVIMLLGHGSAGEAIESYDCNEITFKGNSTTLFESNTAATKGGVISIERCRNLCFRENATIVFSNNTARKGGAIYSKVNSHMYFKENVITLFSNNMANAGGAIYSLSL